MIPTDRQTEGAVLYATGQPLEVMTLSIPRLNQGQVLVDVAYSGVCRSQVLEATGQRGVDRFLPHTLGHEGSGVVLEVGPDVQKVKAGDHVVLSWIKGSGADVPSSLYQSGGGAVNSGAISTFMRHTVTCENRVTPLPADIPLREAALLGCAIPTGAGAVLNVAQARPGSSVAVFGAGGIGLSAVLAADLIRATPVIAIDVIDQKLEWARQAGATHLINALHEDALSGIQQITGGRGVDFSIEAAGLRETMEAAFASVRDEGGLCILGGNLPDGQRICLDPFDLIRGKRIVGTWGGDTDSDRDIPAYAGLYLSGTLKLAALISHEYPLEEVNRALDDLQQGRVARGLIKMRDGP